VAWGWFHQYGVASSRPPVGNAHRWHAHPKLGLEI